MSEKLITIKDNDLNKILGSNNSKFNKIKRLFPHIKLISRGDKIKVVGSKEEIIHFESKFNLFIDHLNKYNSLTINQIERIIEGKENILNGDAKIIIHGKNGNLIKAKTLNQNSSEAEVFNVMGQLQSLQRIKKSGELESSYKEQDKITQHGKPKV